MLIFYLQNTAEESEFSSWFWWQSEWSQR